MSPTEIHDYIQSRRKEINDHKHEYPASWSIRELDKLAQWAAFHVLTLDPSTGLVSTND